MSPDCATDPHAANCQYVRTQTILGISHLVLGVLAMMVIPTLLPGPPLSLTCVVAGAFFLIGAVYLWCRRKQEANKYMLTVFCIPFVFVSVAAMYLRGETVRVYLDPAGTPIVIRPRLLPAQVSKDDDVLYVLRNDGRRELLIPTDITQTIWPNRMDKPTLDGAFAALVAKAMERKGSAPGTPHGVAPADKVEKAGK